MNSERLHAVCGAIRDDLQASNALELLRQLRDSLRNVVNQPQQPTHQQQVSKFLQELYPALEGAASNAFSPSWQQAAAEIGALDLLGVRLAGLIRQVFERNQITPSVALQEIGQLCEQLEELNNAVVQLVTGFSALGIEAEELTPGECELGVLVPRPAVKNRLDEFSVELAKLNRTFGVFTELAIGNRPGFVIRTISSTDLTVFLDIAPKVAACVAVAVERVVALYKQLLEIRRLRKELSEQGLPPAALGGVDTHANAHMREGIDTLTRDLSEQYLAQREKGRRNELENELRAALNSIANRIDKGFHIEVRVQPIEEEGPEGGEKKPQTEVIEAIHTALRASQGLQFLRPAGDPILSLPEPEGGDEKRDRKHP